MKPLYVLLTRDGEFATGGGSSTPSHIRAYDTETGAKRGLANVYDARRYVRYVVDDAEPFGDLAK